SKMSEKDKELSEMDVWKEKVQQDITDLKNNQNQFENEQRSLKSEIESLKTNDKMKDVEISNIKQRLKITQDDTIWIRRKVTGAYITAAITAVVAGLIGIAISKFYGG